MITALNSIAKARGLIEASNPAAAWHVLRTVDLRLLPPRAAAKVAAATDTLTNGTSQTANRLLAEAQKIAAGPKPRGWWSKERCIESAQPFKHKTEWMQAFRGAHKAARLNGWLRECQAHMADPDWWLSLEECKASASKFTSRKLWANGDVSAYCRAADKGWLDECCAHMVEVRHAWTLAECKTAASEWPSRGAWAKGSPRSYGAARKHGWLDECKPMPQSVLPTA